MKISMLLINLILILSVFVPYFLFIRAGIRAQKKKVRTFKQIAKNYKLSPNIEEQWGDSFIGIDSLENTLLFIHLKDNEPGTRLIRLEGVRECRLLQNFQKQKKGKKGEEVLTYLALELAFVRSNRPCENLTFYEAGGSYDQDYEVARGTKWLGLIKEHLKPMKPGQVAA